MTSKQREEIKRLKNIIKMLKREGEKRIGLNTVKDVMKREYERGYKDGYSYKALKKLKKELGR